MQMEELSFANASNTPQLEPPLINERQIVDTVLGVQQGHWRGVRHIIKGKGKASMSTATNYPSMT